MKKLLALLVLLAAPAFAQVNIGNGGAVNIGSGGGGGGIPYPGAGIACSTGSAWCSAYSAGNQIPTSYLNLSAYLTTTSAASTYQPIGSGVTQILAGTNVTVSPTGGTGAVTINAANTGILKGATVAFAGDSELGDDNHALGNSITVTAINCNGTVCIATNSGTNGLVAGGWVDIQGVTSPSFLNVGNAITTGQSLFQILPTGLTTTQFEWAYTANTGTGTGGVAYDASYDLPFQILAKNSFAGYASVYVNATSIYHLATGGYTTYFHPQSPAVKGGTGYLFMMQDEDVYVSSNNPTCTAAAIEGYYQTVWTAAHADGWKIVQESTKPSTQMFTLIGNCSATPAIAITLWQTVNAWMQAQGVSNLNVASGAYWDNWVDMAPAFNTDDDGILATNGRFTGAGIARNAALTNEAIATGGSQILPTAPCEPWSDCAQLDGTNSFSYTNTFQKGLISPSSYTTPLTRAGLEFDGSYYYGFSMNRSFFGYQYFSQPGGYGIGSAVPTMYLQNGTASPFIADQWSSHGDPSSSGYYVHSLLNNGEYGFGPTGSEDTCISRGSAGEVAVGVCGAPGDATGSLVATNSNFSGTISVLGHISMTSTAAPTASSCSGGTAAGNDNAFQVTGISTATSCTVTFTSALQQGYCTANGAVGLVTEPTGTHKSSIVFGILSTETTITAHCF